MSRPFGFAGAIPEVDFIPAIFAEEGLDCGWDDHILKRIDFGLQDFSFYHDGVSDDNNVMGVIHFHGRDESSVNSHEFGLKGCDIYGVDL